MIRKLAISALFLGALSNAHAANWMMLYTDDLATWKIDLTTMTRTGPTATIWVRETFVKPTQYNPADARLVKVSLTHVSYECDARQSRFTSSTAYAEDGSVIFSGGDDGHPYRDVAPESISEILLKVACSTK